MIFDSTNKKFIPNEPIERRNLSLISHDIPGNYPSKFKRADMKQSREASEMYPFINLAHQNRDPNQYYEFEQNAQQQQPEQGNRGQNSYFRNNASQLLINQNPQNNQNQQRQLVSATDPNNHARRMAEQYDDDRYINSTLRKYDKDFINSGAGTKGMPMQDPYELPYQERYRELLGRDYFYPGSGTVNASQKTFKPPQQLNEPSAKDVQNASVASTNNRPALPETYLSQSTLAKREFQELPISQQSQKQKVRFNEEKSSDFNRPENSAPHQESKSPPPAPTVPIQNTSQPDLDILSYKSPPPTSEYKKNFYSFYRPPPKSPAPYYPQPISTGPAAGRPNFRESTINNYSSADHRSKLPSWEHHKHPEIYSSYQQIPADVLNNPRFYITKSDNGKFHIYDLLTYQSSIQSSPHLPMPLSNKFY